MTLAERIITIAVCIIATMVTRFLPFLIFSRGRRVPDYIVRLGRLLPAAAFGLLVVYSFKDMSLFFYPYGLPELIAAITVTGLHLWRRNMLLSIAGGTAVYMLLVNLIF